MTEEDKNFIKEVNKSVFMDLNAIVEKLNKRFSIKLYTIIFNEKDQFNSCLRIRKTISKQNELNQEELYNREGIFRELNPENEFIGIFKNISPVLEEDMKKYLSDKESELQVNDQSKEDLVTKEGTLGIKNDLTNTEGQILYSNLMEVNRNSHKYKIIYVLEIRNVDQEIRSIFLNNPSYSFLRMILDNFFYEYYELKGTAQLNFNEKEKPLKKYNDDSVTFLRRMSRVFFGKIQSILKYGIKSSLEKKIIDNNEKPIKTNEDLFDNQIDRNNYYIYNLFEEIEDISTRTYEGENPFGSILFLSEDFIIENNKKIKYAIEFQEKDRIKLEDSKKIRKLLEVTNEEKGLYLIANHHEILGVGEVVWNDLSEDDQLIRLDFKGLCKNTLVYIYTKIKEHTGGKLIIQNDEKIYQCNKELKIIENNLVTVVFKNPKMKEEEYSSEKFKKIFKTQFYDEDLNDELEKIERVVRKAKDQKHGTMVVVTNKYTAEEELKLLESQSTLIKPTEINPEYVKCLTSIDGAIYFDTKGMCHGIGVILDGVANERIGDASRGARYNSAYKYLKKLESKSKKCIIVIISEDGMVDIIPDLDNENRIRSIVQEIIYLINEADKSKQEQLTKHEEELKGYNNSIEHYLYFEIAEEFYKNKKYEKAVEYYERGFTEAKENSVIISKHYENIGMAYIHLGNEYREYEKIGSKEYYQKALASYNKCIKMLDNNNLSIKSKHYNYMGMCNTYIGNSEKNKKLKNDYFKKAIERYTKAINIEKISAYYNNRGITYNKLEMYKDAIEDYINSFLLSKNQTKESKTINRIKRIINENNELATKALGFYRKECEVNNVKDDTKQLENLLEKYTSKISNNIIIETQDEKH